MTKSKGPAEGQTAAEVAKLEASPRTPTQPTSKRTRRQSRITDAFSVGRRSAARMTGKDGLRSSSGEVLASPTLRKRPEVARESLEAARRSLEEARRRSFEGTSEGEKRQTTEEIVIGTSPLVGFQDDDDDDEGKEKSLGEPYESTVKACLKGDDLLPLSGSNDCRSALTFGEDIILPKEREALPPRGVEPKKVAERAPARAALEDETIVIHEDPPTAATTPVKELAVTMVADNLPAVPAYQRYAHLLSGPRPFALPAKFLLLERILGALDSICMLSAGRNQPVIFHRALKSVEASVGRRVELVHLQQIVGLFGDAALGGALECYRLRPTRFVNYGKRISSLAVELPEQQTAATHDYLLGRRTELLRRLTAKVAAHHDSFLASISVSLPSGAKMRAWHPKFDVESVPDLEAINILPAEQQELDGSQPAAAIPKVVVKAIIAETANEGGDRAEQLEKAPSETNSKGEGGLLERIRAKQRAAELAQMTHDPVREALRKKYQDLVEFSETVAMYRSQIGNRWRLSILIIHVSMYRLFATSNRSSLLLGDAVTKICQGSRTSLSSSNGS